MTPKGPGGRPPNAWTHSRRRKLVRLYTLTTLTNKEIQSVLEEDGFSPKSRDIQMKLRELLPKDYSKKFLTYKPKNDDDMCSRLTTMRKISKGRVSKARRHTQSQKRLSFTLSRRMSATEEGFTGPYHAFRNYADYTTPVLTQDQPTSTIADSQLVNSFHVMLDGSMLTPRAIAKSRRSAVIFDCCAFCRKPIQGPEVYFGFSCTHKIHEACRSDSQLGTNCLECSNGSYLDSVSIGSTTPKPEVPKSTRQGSRQCKKPETIIYTSALHPKESTSPASTSLSISAHSPPTYVSVAPKGHNTRGDSIAEFHYSDPEKTPLINQTHISTQMGLFDPHLSRPKESSALNAGILATLLPNRSPSFVNRIRSTLRLSSTDSCRTSASDKSMLTWRSSWMSFSSRNTRLSKLLPEQQSLSAHQETLDDPKVYSNYSLPSSGVSKGKQEVWDELIIESEVESRHTLPKYLFNLIQMDRKCCGLLNPTIRECKECGFLVSHWYATLCLHPVNRDINQRDHFGNTPLHFAAASGRANYDVLMTFINGGADINARNSSGETFMHVLNTDSFGFGQNPITLYRRLLYRLEKLEFAVHSRDSHGRTVAHVALSNPMLFGKDFIDAVLEGNQEQDRYDSPNPLDLLWDHSYVVQYLSNELATLDNQGCNVVHSATSMFPEEDQDRFRQACRRFLAPITALTNIDIDFNSNAPQSKHWDPDQWLLELKKANILSWVDIRGNTPLIALLKKWRNEEQELELRDTVFNLIQSGSDINIRDRKGHSALSIAAIRGSRPSVQVLLEAGAMPNSRTYQGRGILALAAARMRRAQEQGQDDRYARILSCVNLLMTYGAKLEPTEHNEWVILKLYAMKNHLSYGVNQYRSSYLPLPMGS
ncbi:hypothetical protein G7Y89_g12751 [Cudoniella acicularis]|uniref:Uncharacterized protein n=1 Tax=Cudoniella acicularis TaxID=354080 RepID=A0A8H4RB83_9HELO|nr:hypothetical protein G7Y89_g12751 [Cudoniella acicularis]